MNREVALQLKRSLALVLASAVVLTPATTPLLAQGKKPAAGKPDKATQDKARDAYKRGEEKMAAGEFEAAAAAYKEADALIPTPQAQYKMALAYDKAGKNKEALESYKALLANALPDKMADQKAAAEKRVAELSEAAKPKAGTVKIASNPTGASIKVDGEMSLDVTPATLTLKPGLHRIELSMKGREIVKKDVDVAAGANPDVTADLPEAAAAPPPPATSSAPPPPPPATTSAEVAPPKSKTPAYVTLGIAGGAAVVGTFFGLKALSAKSDFNKTPTTDNADKAEKNALIADMAFGVAVTLGITGAVLLATSGKSEQKGKVQLAPIVGKTNQGAALRFTF